MPKKVTRSDRKSTGSTLYRPKKIVPPQKRKTEDVSTSGASAKKIKVTFENQLTEDLEKYYKIIDFLLVFSTIATLVKCVKCGGKINFHPTKKEGLGFNIRVSCKSCKQITNVPSSPRINSGIYEINYRFVFVMRILGLGLSGCEKFCGLMDLSTSFVSRPTYNDYMKKMCSTVKEAANRFFLSATNEEKSATAEDKKTEDTNELTVSSDRTWKKIDLSSLFSVTSLIGYFTCKILDIFVKNSYCNECKTWENKLDSAEYEDWHEAHVNTEKCQANNSGAGENMKTEAIKAMFQRSIRNGVKYRNYISDGDSKSYSVLVNSKPYGDDFSIIKKECVEHIQKIMSTRLREIVKKTVINTETKFTAKMIDKLTLYYGLAIRRYSDSMENMKNAIWAAFFHYSSTDENPQHKKCPTGADSWCEWQKAAAANKLDSFKHTYSAFPNDVLDAIKPIYEDLSKDAFLKNCVGGFTQNNNESLNQLIWEMSPKELNESSVIVEIAAYVAACVFNEGYFALLTLMQDMGISSGPSAHDWARSNDSMRISRANIRDDSNILYGPGIDDSECSSTEL